MRSIGSSPRLRGTLNRQAASSVLVRFIPAFAGNAPSAPAAAGKGTVHPRVCGERRARFGLSSRAHGSSPRLRGTRVHPPSCGHAKRFIPAFAGNAMKLEGLRIAMSVHPRVCGERGCVAKDRQGRAGSSPRLRGTPCITIPRVPPHRFIPAFAGNASLVCLCRSFRAVHPRVCGERYTRRRERAIGRGSSPRLRGTP